MWSTESTCGEHYDIFEIEAVGPALILNNLLYHSIPGAFWLHCIDNAAALATLVKGSSSVLSGECLIAYSHAQVAKAGV